jgi:UDP-2,4-diacetamido-2,4,6-trideoxy-beta-L-altropyranose hydrolase
MRCLSLAGALAARGAAPIFAVAPGDARLIERFAPALAPPLIRPAEIGQIVRRGACDAVVVDDYGLIDTDERTLRRYGCRVLMVVDDLADRPHIADLLLDPGHGRGAQDYAALLPPTAEVLAGPAYALLRPEFARLRDEARPLRTDVERVFVSFGLSDVASVTIRALDVVRPLAPRARFDVAVGAQAPSLAALQALAAGDPGVVVYVETADAAALMGQADLAVGAGGGSAWERCCLGLPSLTVIVADNQRPTVEALAADGVLTAVDLAERRWEHALSEGFTALLDPARRQALRTASLVLCDGRGAERAADALLARIRLGSG